MVGPHAQRLGAAVIEALLSTEYRATPRSSRQALRLDGMPLASPSAADALSAGVSAGCVQVTGDGLPLVMLSEHQTTGGYAVALCVIWADVPRAAQIRPGDVLRFERVAIGAARTALEQSVRCLRSLRPVDPREDVSSAEERLARGFFEGTGP
jgi:allophanate hydrolase subunit 2